MGDIRHNDTEVKKDREYSQVIHRVCDCGHINNGYGGFWDNCPSCGRPACVEDRGVVAADYVSYFVIPGDKQQLHKFNLWVRNTFGFRAGHKSWLRPSKPLSV